jgi:hypothetical protein
MDYKHMWASVKKIHKSTGRNSLKLFLDMAQCGFKYGAGYVDYEVFRFYSLTPAQRSTFITRTISNKIRALLNDEAYAHILANKTEFNEYYSEYIGREWLNFKQADLAEFSAFIAKFDAIIIKPDASNSGDGVEKVTISETSNVEELYTLFKEKHIGIIEEFVKQNSQMAHIYPHSLNTVRAATVLDSNGKAVVMKMMLRVGSGGNVVDNLNAGGLTAWIDTETGIVKRLASDKKGHKYASHPDTGVKFEGFSVPYWQECLQLAKAAAEKIPQLGYVGWDIAFSEAGPILIEGNHIPSHHLIQMPDNLEEEKIGMLPEYRKYVKGI